MSRILNKRLSETDRAEDRVDDGQALPDLGQRSDAGLIEILERMRTDVRAERQPGDRVRKQG